MRSTPFRTPSSGSADSLAGALIELAGVTDRGRKPTSNQDSLALDETTGVAVVADGVGGERAGEVASAIVTRTVRDAVRKRLLAVAGAHVNSLRLREPELALIAQAALVDAHCEVLDNATAAGRDGMASTVVLVFVHAELATISWAGDSSVFLLREDSLKQLTRGHSLEEDLSGGRAAEPGRRRKGPLTMAAGSAGDPFMPEVRHERIRSGDILLLCSDGLTDMLEDREVARIIGRHRDSLDAAAAALVAAANDAGGEDNVTVALIGIHKTPGQIAADRGDRNATNLLARLQTRVRPAALALFTVGLVSGSLLTFAAKRGLEPASLANTGSVPADVRRQAVPQPNEPQASLPSPGVLDSSRSVPTKPKSAATLALPPTPSPQAPTVPEAAEQGIDPTPAVLPQEQGPKRGKASPSTDGKDSAQRTGSSAGGNASPSRRSRRPTKSGPSTEDGK